VARSATSVTLCQRLLTQRSPFSKYVYLSITVHRQFRLSKRCCHCRSRQGSGTLGAGRSRRAGSVQFQNLDIPGPARFVIPPPGLEARVAAGAAPPIRTAGRQAQARIDRAGMIPDGRGDAANVRFVLFQIKRMAHLSQHDASAVPAPAGWQLCWGSGAAVLFAENSSRSPCGIYASNTFPPPCSKRNHGTNPRKNPQMFRRVQFFHVNAVAPCLTVR